MQIINSFSEFEVSDNIKRAIEDMGFVTPTPIQSEVIPYILVGKDVIAQAPTGTGKTCAFAIPIIQNIDVEGKEVQALILCPTRELVIQMANEFKEVLKYTEGVRLTPVYGGQNIERQLATLRKKPQIIIGTPGRIMDHLNRKTIRLHNLSMLVLDEADEMLDMGFRQDLDIILKTCPQETKQTVLFSATMPKAIVDISRNYQKDPISIITKITELPSIEQVGVCCTEKEKVTIMTDILDNYGYQLSIAFCNTKKRVDELSTILNGLGYNSEALHGDLRQSQRDRIMKKYRAGDTRILVATDVAARGIDVDNVEAIFNFDTPNDEEYYVHRIGRTARANKTGIAYTFYTKSQADLIKKYERYTKTSMSKMDNLQGSADFESKKLANLFRGLSTNLTETKSFVAKALTAYNIEHNSEWTELDLIAVALNGDTGIAMTENNSRKHLERRERASSPSTRFFLTIGSIDNASEDNVKKFVCSMTGMDEIAIVDVHLLEKFGFVEIAEGMEDMMSAVNGATFNGRKVTCEVAGDRKSGADRRTSSRDSRPSGGRGYSDRRPSGERSFGDRQSSGERSYGDRKPSGERSYGDRKPSGERSFGDRQSSGERSYGDRRPSGERSFGDRQSSGERSYGDRRPSGERSFGDRQSSGERSYGDRRPSGERSFGDRKPAGERSFGDRKPAGERSFGDRKPAGERSFGDRKPAGERSFGDRKPAGERSFGDRKPSSSRTYSDSRPSSSRSYDRKPSRGNR